VTAISDLRVPDGTIVLPPVNERASGPSSDGLSSSPSIATLSGAGLKPSAPPSHENAVTKPVVTPAPGSESQKTAPESTAAASGLGTGGLPTAKRILLPKDGKFTMVSVGNSMEELYPETEGIWNGRLAYTVYLHVGLPKSWILQYSLPRSEEAAGTGAAGRLDAPWPTDILVPNLPPGSSNSDALVVHGLLDAEGHFQQLAVVFPPDWEHAQYVTETLQHWAFRPAMQNGKAAQIEVLLMIPQTAE
jgi:hypothetical protein